MDPGWVKTGEIYLLLFSLLYTEKYHLAMGGEGAFLEIPFSVSHQHKIITSATQKDSGTFKRYNGEALPW